MTSKRRTRLALALTAAGALSAALLAPAAQAGADGVRPECPRALGCDWVPAAYQQTGDPADKETYGNYDTADRPHSNRIKFIVLHDTEVDFDTTLKIFQNPLNQTSAHYVVRSSDGHVTQMVKNKDVAWQAGNWYLNTHSIGIEQEGFAAEGAKWYTPEMYRSTAGLVRHLAAQYGIPLDRQHIIGHDGVPPTSASGTRNMHWDPGPYWDWNRFMALLGRPTVPTAPRGAELITVSPDFKRNKQVFRDCEKGVDLPLQGSSAVPLYTEPSTGSPLFADPGLHPDGSPGTNCAADWGSKISATQQGRRRGQGPGVDRDLVVREEGLAPDPGRGPGHHTDGRSCGEAQGREGGGPGVRGGVPGEVRVPAGPHVTGRRQPAGLHDQGGPGVPGRRRGAHRILLRADDRLLQALRPHVLHGRTEVRDGPDRTPDRLREGVGRGCGPRTVTRGAAGRAWPSPAARRAGLSRPSRRCRSSRSGPRRSWPPR
ncbi:N-acetylmuramoyl-L-alanine amidase [Streptomyces sp. TE33382]